MGRITLKPQGGWEVFDSGYYIAEIENVEEVEHAADDYHDQPYPQLKWTFLLHIPGREDYPKYSAWTSLSLNKKSKLYPLVESFGIPNDGKSFDVDDAIGKFGRINLEESKKADGTPTNRVAGYAVLKGNKPASALLFPPEATGKTVTGSKPAPKPQELPESEVPF